MENGSATCSLPTAADNQARISSKIWVEFSLGDNVPPNDDRP